MNYRMLINHANHAQMEYHVTHEDIIKMYEQTYLLWTELKHPAASLEPDTLQSE